MRKNQLKFTSMRALLSALMVCSFALFASCGDDAEGRIEINNAAPAKVTEVSAAQGPGEVYLSWRIPESASFMYTKVEYLDAKGERQYQIITKEKAENGICKATISGFANTDPVTFSLFSCSLKGNNIGAVEFTASPDTPAFAVVAETVAVEPIPGGVKVSWNNESVAQVYVTLNYTAKNDASKGGTVRIPAPPSQKGVCAVALPDGVGGHLMGEACDIKVTTQDEVGNASEEFPFEATPVPVVRLSQEGWSFPGYEDSYNATIGYSSQEAGGEGGSPKGRVIAMIDDDENTFWHTAWKQASAYPHFFILDLGKDVEVNAIDIRRRTNNDGTHKGQTFALCADADAADKSNPDSWKWQNQGHSAFDPTTNNYQMFPCLSTTKARYIKVSFAAGDQGSSNFVMISEINVYGPEK